MWRVQGFKFVSSGAGGSAIDMEFGASIYLGNNIYGACSAAHIAAAYGACKIELVDNYSIVGGAPSHITLNGCSTCLAYNSPVVTISNTPAFSTAFVQVVDNSLAQLTGMTFPGSGATGNRYYAVQGGGIDTQGGGPNFFPGSNPGFATSPGWYA